MAQKEATDKERGGRIERHQETVFCATRLEWMRGNIWFVGVEGIRGLLTQLTTLHCVSASIILSVPSVSVSFLCMCLAVTQDRHQPVVKNGDGRGSSSAEQVSRRCFKTVSYFFFLETRRNCQWFFQTTCFRKCRTD